MTYNCSWPGEPDATLFDDSSDDKKEKNKNNQESNKTDEDLQEKNEHVEKPRMQRENSVVKRSEKILKIVQYIFSAVVVWVILLLVSQRIFIMFFFLFCRIWIFPSLFNTRIVSQRI